MMSSRSAAPSRGAEVESERLDCRYATYAAPAAASAMETPGPQESVLLPDNDVFRPLLADQREVARLEGTFICPEGAACVTAVRELRESGWLSGSDEVVVLNTGSGLIYPDTVPSRAPVLSPSGSIPPG